MARIGKLYDDTRGRLSRVLAAVRREPTGVRPTIPVRIKLGDLPAPLRAVVRDESHGGILIEAELPWLTVGSAVQTEFSDGREKAGRVHWFGVDATRVGSARLRIFVDLSSADASGTEQPTKLPDLSELRPAGPSMWRWAVATTILVIVASMVVYVFARRTAAPALWPSPVAIDPTPPRVPAAVSAPKQQPESASAEAEPAPSPVPKIASPAAKPPHPKPKRKKR
jgi:hypothetical protein